jgi:hypothetical protein
MSSLTKELIPERRLVNCKNVHIYPTSNVEENLTPLKYYCNIQSSLYSPAYGDVQV